jgi:hypothetical protein
VNTKSFAIISCWASVTIISVVYLLVFGDHLGDILFGFLLPIGILVFLALIVTVLALISSKTRA